MTLLCGCSRTQADWRAAQQAGTPRAYEVFVQRHPDSELAGVARQRMAQLAEDAAWQQAARENTAAAYQQYLATYPKGSWSQDARIRMQSKELLPQAPQAPPAAQSGVPTVQSVRAPASAAVRPAASSPVASAAGHAGSSPIASAAEPPFATSAPDGAGSSAVQLGAFSTSANARTQWRQLSSKFPAELRGLSPRVVPVTLSGRRLYRLEARVASRAAARRLCRQLQQHSQGCLPVP
ncbi:MAG TPA: SPOR domain-containing protein [Steroidobacteraceae bacterium]|nr:SPOR domain-containing protein [Steroidobacteraceae bacterium]